MGVVSVRLVVRVGWVRGRVDGRVTTGAKVGGKGKLGQRLTNDAGDDERAGEEVALEPLCDCWRHGWDLGGPGERWVGVPRVINYLLS